MTEEPGLRLEELLSFLSSRRPADNEEFADDLADYAAQLRSSSRGGGHHTKKWNDKTYEVHLPPDLAERETEWIAACLHREAHPVESVRWHLGFDEVPFPGDVETADALGEWLWEHLNPEPQLVIRTSSRGPSETTRKALESLRPRASIRVVEKSDEENQTLAFSSALRSLSDEADRLADRVGCERNEALRWILAGQSPEHACIQARASSNLDGPNTVTLSVNADVVTPEEIRTLYRQMRRIASPPDEELSVFLDPIFGNMGGTWQERLERWNEAHPLRKYKNVASFKAAAWRVKRRQRKQA